MLSSEDHDRNEAEALFAEFWSFVENALDRIVKENLEGKKAHLALGLKGDGAVWWGMMEPLDQIIQDKKEGRGLLSYWSTDKVDFLTLVANQHFAHQFHSKYPDLYKSELDQIARFLANEALTNDLCFGAGRLSWAPLLLEGRQGLIKVNEQLNAVPAKQTFQYKVEVFVVLLELAACAALLCLIHANQTELAIAALIVLLLGRQKSSAALSAMQIERKRPDLAA